MKHVSIRQSSISFLTAICILSVSLSGVSSARAETSGGYVEEYTPEHVEYDEEGRINAVPETFDIDWRGIGNAQEPADTRPSAESRGSFESESSSRKPRQYDNPQPSARGESKPFPLMLTLRISSAALAAGGFAGGLYYNSRVSNERDKYKVEQNPAEAGKLGDKMEDYAGKRNLMYILGGVGLAGFSVTFLF